MVVDSRIIKLKTIISAIQTEFKNAANAGKAFYIKKEILQRLRLAMNELEEMEFAASHNDL